MSQAATSTFLPSVWSRLASLAMEVVLPDPFTPAIITTVGPVGGVRDARGRVGEQLAELLA